MIKCLNVKEKEERNRKSGNKNEGKIEEGKKENVRECCKGEKKKEKAKTKNE